MSLSNAAQVAEQLGVSRQRVYELVRRGDLPCVRLGRTVRFDPTSLDEWISKGGKPLPGGWRRQPSE